MRDQSFSAKNFRYISEAEKRKGRVYDQKLFPSVKAKTDVLRDLIQEAKDFRKRHTGKYSASDQAIFDDIKRRREEARSDRDNTLLEELEKVSHQVSKRSFQVNLI
ncbi:hypothetical protein [Palleronia sp.]|uniref:hypothetical protein n=1 Tax=Palleronia sp. TaxID=1940284 RepID=UPI0035C87109